MRRSLQAAPTIPHWQTAAVRVTEMTVSSHPIPALPTPKAFHLVVHTCGNNCRTTSVITVLICNVYKSDVCATNRRHPHCPGPRAPFTFELTLRTSGNANMLRIHTPLRDGYVRFYALGPPLSRKPAVRKQVNSLHAAEHTPHQVLG